jgi:hypothetical protein
MRRGAIAMAEAEERIADAAEKEAMEHARGRDAAGSRLRDAGHAGEAAAVRGLPPQAGKEKQDADWLPMRRRRGKSDKGATSWSSLRAE